MANIITAVRMVCALSLIFCPTFSARFYVIYIIGGISDVLDGFTARHFGKETKFGAQLDTAADIAFTAVVIIKVVRAVSVPLWLIAWIIFIAAVKCVNIVIGFLKHKRFVSAHTVLNKICGILLFAVPLYIGEFSWQSLETVMLLNCCVATVAAFFEGYYIYKF